MILKYTHNFKFAISTISCQLYG